MDIVIGYLVGVVLTFLILFLVVRAAVESALENHYKMVRWYEHTGEWVGKRAPREFATEGSGPAGS